MYKIIKNVILSVVIFNLTTPVNVLAGLSADEYQTKFLKCIDDREYEQALKIIDEAISTYPKNAENYNLRGMAHMKLHEYEKSVTDSSLAIQLLTSQNKSDPNISSYYINRSQAYIDLNQVGAAIDDLKTAIKIYPDHCQLYYNLAVIDADKLDDYKAALNNINIAINLDPSQISYYRLRGNIYDDLGMFEKAEAEFKEIIVRVPKFYAGYYELGCLYLKHGQNDKAQEYFAKATDIDPKNYELCNNIGSQYNYYESDIKALEYFNKSLKIKPNADAYCGKASIFDNRLVNYQAALDNINLAIKLNPNVSKYYQIQGYIYEHLDQTPLAIEAFGSEIKLSPNYCKGYAELGHIYLKAKKNELAKYYYDKAIETEQGPQTYKLYYQIGLSYCLNDDPGEGIKYFDKAIELKPLAQIYHGRGVAKRAVHNRTDKDFKDAIADFNQSFRLDPDNISTLEDLVETKYYCNDYKGVISDVSQYLKNHQGYEINNIELLEYYGFSLFYAGETTGELEEAIKCFEKVASLKPNYRSNYYHLGEAYYYNSNYSLAYDALRLDIQQKIANNDLKNEILGLDYSRLGQLITLLGIKVNALDYLNKAVSLLPNGRNSYINRAEYYITQLKFKEAINDLNMAIKLDPGEKLIIRLQIITYFLAGQYNKSFEICQKVISSHSNNFRERAIIYGYLNYKYSNQPYKAKQFIKQYLKDPQIDEDYKVIFKYLCGMASLDALLAKIKAKSNLDFGNICVFAVYLNDNQKDNDALKAYLIHEDPDDVNYLCALALAKRHHLPIPCRYEPSNSKSN